VPLCAELVDLPAGLPPGRGDERLNQLCRWMGF